MNADRTEIDVDSNSDIRRLPIGHYRVVRGNAEVRVVSNPRSGGHGNQSREMVVLLRFPCTLSPIEEEEGPS